MLTLIFVVLTVVMAVAPTLAAPDPNKPLVTKYYCSGKVILQLPPPSNASPPAAPGTPSHPISLQLIALDLDRRSTFGAHDELYVALWVPQPNAYIPVAYISDNDAAGQDFYKMLWNNSGLWSTVAFAPGFENVIAVADKELEVWSESVWTSYGSGHKGWDYESSNTFIVNLTKSVKISLPWNTHPVFSSWGNQSFTLPPMTLVFHETGDPFYKEEIEVQQNLPPPFPPYSGYTMKTKVWFTPSWVEVSIPSWIRYATLDVTGRTGNHGTATYIPPA